MLVVGSRGGQVVLPFIWRALGARSPPVAVINGGCAMKLPVAVDWPLAAATFLLLGGRDTFSGAMSAEAYIADAKSRVPSQNRTTAILFVSEMLHMPQTTLLRTVLPWMLKALAAWKASGLASPPPSAEFQALLAALKEAGCWSGRLLYTQQAGGWQDTTFGPAASAATTWHQRLTSPAPSRKPGPTPQQRLASPAPPSARRAASLLSPRPRLAASVPPAPRGGRRSG